MMIMLNVGRDSSPYQYLANKLQAKGAGPRSFYKGGTATKKKH